MDIYMGDKNYFKESKDIQKAIIESVDDLYKRICYYEGQHISFEKIFNDDKVKYDKHGKFYTFKSKKNHLQLRLLYSFFYIEKTPIILVADYIIKKKNNKDYIKRFDSINDMEPMIIYDRAYRV